jgi:hypothetical protein
MIDPATFRYSSVWPKREPSRHPLSIAIDIVALVLAVTVAISVCSYAAYRHGEQAGYKQAQAELMVGRGCK